MASSSSRHDWWDDSSRDGDWWDDSWDGDETGLNTGFFETSDSDLEIFRTSGSDADASGQRKEPKQNVLKKTSQKKETSSSSGSNSSSDDDTTNHPTSSGDEKPTAKKMKIEETVKTESKSSSEHKFKLLAENNDHLQDTIRRRDETIMGLNEKNLQLSEKNLQLSEKLKKISKTQDAFMCIICFDSVSI